MAPHSVKKMNKYVVLLRMHQYIKNLVVFFPLFFSSQIVVPHLLLKTSVAFIAFSLVASSMYVFNDYHDIEGDRNHPNKKNRPLVSGEIPKQSAIYLIIFLLLGGLVISYLLGRYIFILVVLYVVINIGYTLKLKHIAIIDVIAVSAGFVVRLFVGGVISNIELSTWIVLMTFLVALFVTLAKRRDDVIIYLSTSKKVRKIVDGYNVVFLNACMGITASIIVVSYIMYTLSPEVRSRINNDYLYTTSLFVIVGIMKYFQIAFVRNDSGSPIEIIYKDRFMQLVILGWLVVYSILLYG